METATEKRAFVLELGRLLHESGASAGRLEAALRGASAELDLQAEVFSTPTGLTLSFGEMGSQQTSVMRVVPGEVHLEKLALVDRVAERVAAGELSVRDGRAELRAIVRAPNRWPRWLMIVAQIVIAAGAARIFGGSLGDAAAASVLGGVIAALTWALQRNEHSAYLTDFGAGAVVAAGALAWNRFVFPISEYPVTLAAIIVLIPGLTLTLSISELATRHLVSGTARLMGGLMVLVSLGFGVAIGRQLERVLPPMAETGPGVTAQGELGQAIAIGLLGVMLAIVFRARPKDILPVVLAVSLGVYGARFGAGLLSPELGPAIGAFVLGLFSNAWSRLRRQPAAITTIPALLPLVPGSIGFTGLNAMLTDDTMTGVDTFFTMLLVGVSLVAGLLLANVVYGPRTAV
ncbi:MAG: threonine/serine exporter family protein [Phycisphaerales bacterium]|nr:threonine/serine exporter family protein [Phycisphaerales bacterium]